MVAALLLLVQVPKTVVPTRKAQVELVLSVDRPVVAKGEDPGYHAVIRNNGTSPLRLLEPQDGSELGWRNPAIGWTLPDLTTRTTFMRCGNTNAIDPTSFFTLAPGESREISTGWGGSVELRPGSNRVSFTYDIDAKRQDRGLQFAGFAGETPAEFKAAQERLAKLYGALTPVKLKSNVVRVTLRESP